MKKELTVVVKCKSGKHWWTQREDAAKCCNGYVRILVIGGGDNQQVVEGVVAGRAWVKKEDVAPRGGEGPDRNCENCGGHGGILSDGSCGACWDAQDASII